MIPHRSPQGHGGRPAPADLPTVAAAPALEYRGVTVRYGRGADAVTAVDAVDLVVPAGAVVGLVGESGSGKSTLARAAVGLAPVSAGEVLVGGVPLPRRPRGRRPVQMVFQDPQSAFDPRQQLGDAIGEAMRDLPREQRRTEAARLLDLVGLDPALADRVPAGLSGGQRQRASLARALAARPSVLIADEITSALDVSVQGAVLNVLREVIAALQLSVLFVSHNLAVVRYLSDTVAVMERGRLVEQVPAAGLTTAATHPYTRTLLAAVPDIRHPERLLAAAGEVTP